MKRIVLNILFCSLLFTSCKNEKHVIKFQTEEIKEILHFETKKQIWLPSFDSLFKKKNIVELETKPESLISSINKIELYNNNYYIIDRNNHAVNCFDKSGKFKFKLKKIGKGPGEYIRFSDASVNEFTGDIELIANYGRDFMIYDSLGNFKQQVKLPYIARNFCSIKNRRYFFKGLSKIHQNEKVSFRVYSLDNNNKDLTKHLFFKTSDTPEAGVHYIDAFSKVKKGEYRFIEKYNDTIYKVDSTGFKPLYAINFKGYEGVKPPDLLTNIEKYKNERKLAKELKFPSIRSFYEYDNYITGTYSKMDDESVESFAFFIYEKKRKKLISNQNIIQFSTDIRADMAGILPNTNINNIPASYIESSYMEDCINDPQWEFYDNKKSIKETLSSYFEYNNDEFGNPYIIQYETNSPN